MATRIQRTRPVRPVLPGEILKAELEAREWTQQELADIMGRPLTALNQIIVGKKQITPETATELGRALGTSAEFWLNLEQAYRLHEARSAVDEPKLRAIDRRRELLEAVPCLSDLLKRGWVEPTENTNDLHERVLSFFGIPSLDAVASHACAAVLRQSRAATADQVTVLAWVRQVLLEASRVRVSSCTAGGLRLVIPELLKQTMDVESVARVPQLLADVGVPLVIVPTLPKSRIDGAALRVEDRPVVALSLRHDRLDWFWFTLLHELAHHVLGHDGSRIDFDATAPDPDDPQEVAANRMARDWLIPPEEYEAFLATVRGSISRRMVEDFAAAIHRHPSIVVGRLQFDGRLPYTHLNGTKVKVAHLLAA